MKNYMQRLLNAASLIADAEYFVIALGAGLSYELGARIYGDRLYSAMGDLTDESLFVDMYDGFRLPYSQQRRWAFMSRFAHFNLYEERPLDIYRKLLNIIGGRPHFIISSSVDNLARRAEFADSDLFSCRGRADKLQCLRGCHNVVYPFDDLCKKMCESGVVKIMPTELIPMCPVCGGDMTLNVDIYNDYFVESYEYKEEYDRYYSFIRKAKKHKLLFIELGERAAPEFGKFNARYVIEHITHRVDGARILRINKYEPQGRPCNYNKTVCFDESIVEVIGDIDCMSKDSGIIK